MSGEAGGVTTIGQHLAERQVRGRAPAKELARLAVEGRHLGYQVAA